MNELPLHLLLPLLASLLFVCGLLFIKRASTVGVSPWTVTFIANQWAALLFSIFWLLGGEGQPLSMLWQPAVIAGLYILGQVFTFSAIQHGDVSVATPVFGVKVVMVSFLVTFLFGETLAARVWWGAALATLGIALVQWSPRTESTDRANIEGASGRAKILLTLLLAIMAAAAFATFDVLIQAWAPAWGVGRLLPAVYWMVGVLSCVLLPVFQFEKLKDRTALRLLLPGTLLIALQAICIVSTLAIFGDAARVNVVYAMRAMWSVILAWLVAVMWGGNEATLPREVMAARLLGAGLLTISVVLVVMSG